MRQGPGFGPRSSASARSSSGGGVRHAGSNPSEGSERSYDWSYVRSLSMLPSRPRLGPSPWRESSILNPGEAMWGPRNAYVGSHDSHPAGVPPRMIMLSVGSHDSHPAGVPPRMIMLSVGSHDS